MRRQDDAAVRRALGRIAPLSLLALGLVACGQAAPTLAPAEPTAAVTLAAGPWQERTLASPDRVEVLDGSGAWLATFTEGARTVTLRGPLRVFGEPATTAATVSSTTWVRLLPEPFAGAVPVTWLRDALRSTAPDALAIAMQYVTNAPTLTGADGQVVAGDADFGPVGRYGRHRVEGADFNDYLGMTWTYAGRDHAPDPRRRRSLDCSGFVRMVYGYRLGVPLGSEPAPGRLPRRAVEIMASGPGVLLAPAGRRPPLAALAPGDLLFFDTTRGDGNPANHAGIYLGVDSDGQARFVSSRGLVNGPSMGDVGEASVISGDGWMARVLRAARRL